MINTTSTLSRARLYGGTAVAAVAAMFAGGSAFAQTAPTTQTAQAAAADEATIIVTGTLIRNPNLTASAPVNVTSAEEVKLRQNNVAEELLRTIPGVVPNIGSAVNNGNGGASYVDLRGLGSFRNIVLLDGARIAPSGLAGRVDLNNIPLALIESTQVLTGGASTTYGADAVSGVVNFVTRQNFSGVEISSGYKVNEKGDGQYFRTDLTIGGNFAEGKGNAVFSIGYQKSDPVYQGDRDYSNVQFSSFTGGAAGSGLAPVPSRFSFQGGGIPGVNRITGTRQLDPATGGVRTTGPGTYARFNFNPYNVFNTPFSRYNMYGAAKYAVADSLEFYTRGLFSKNTVNTIIAPSGSFGSPVKFPLSNPYLPALLRNQLCANNDFVPDDPNNPATLGVQPLTQAQCDAAAVATNPNDPNYKVAVTNLNRRFAETGPRVSEFVTQIFDYKAGVRGNITDNLKYDVWGAYGESENRQTQTGYIVTSKLRDALLATNTTTCLSGNAGCVPINVFGPVGTITAAMIPYVTGPSFTLVKTSLVQAHAGVSGDLGFTSPAATNPVGFAVGAEYRKYKADQLADALSAVAGELGGGGGAVPEVHGAYDVREVFGELIAPLAEDKLGFKLFSVEAGVRYSSYTVRAQGRPKFNTFTYKAGLTWEPVDGLKLRGMYQRAIRAPNIGELFTPVTTGLTNLQIDPCAGDAPVNNATLKAVCLAQGAPAFTIGAIQNPAVGQANITSGGNPNVKPEKSTSYTLGVVLQPHALADLSLSVDYYHIKITDAITTPTPGDLIARCFGNLTAASATDPNCTSIRRSPSTGGLDGDPATTPGLFGVLTNQGKLLTDGIDVVLNYRRDIGFAKLSLAFDGNYTFRSKFKSNQADPLALDRECTGYYSVNCASIQPQFQWSQRTTLGFNWGDISLLWRHIDRAVQEPQDVIDSGAAYSGPVPSGTNQSGQGVTQGAFGDRNFGHIKPYDYFDLAARFDVSSNLEITLNIANLFNRQPPIVGTNIGSTLYNSGNTYPSTYDTMGRRYGVAARLKF